MNFHAWGFCIRHRVAILLLLIAVLAACGGPGGRAATTPLPPGERIPQPTPVFPVAVTPASVQPTSELAGPEPTVDPVQALVATQIALRAADPERASATATPTPTSSAVADAATRRSPAQSPLNRPSSLGIVGGAGAGLFGSPGGTLVRSLPAGATVTITGRSGDGGWYAAYLIDGQTGWVASGAVQVFGDRDLLQVVGDSVSPGIVATMIAQASQPTGPIATPAPATIHRAATPTATPPPETGEGAPDLPPSAPQAVVIVDGLNVRGGPGTDFPVVGGLVRADRVSVLARNDAGDWLQIETPQGVGWVFAPLVEAEVHVAELPVSDQQ